MSIRHSSYLRIEKRSATTFDEKQHSLNSILPARAARYYPTKPDESRTNRATFIEDFSLGL